MAGGYGGGFGGGGGFRGALRDLGAVEVTLGGVGVPIKIIPVGEGVEFFNNGTNQENEYCCNSDEHGKVIIAFLR